MQLIVVSFLLGYIITLYFMRNPLKHTPQFMWRRFLSWFPLGMTYGFLYMARYNLDTLATTLVITKQEKSIASGWGFFVYAASLFVSGPLIDRIGGKKGMVMASLGSAIANIIMGWVLYLHMNGNPVALVPLLTIFYSVNMFFQSFGAISTIKVKSFWFHVRERGTFGAIFGTLISLGVYFAFDWCDAIAKAVDVKIVEGGALRDLLSHLTGSHSPEVSAFWLVFFIPAAFLLVWSLICVIMIKDTPDEAGFLNFETHDASHGQQAHQFESWIKTLRTVFSNRVLLAIGAIEFTSGVLRDGTMKWYRLFANDTGMNVPHINSHWGLYAAITGIVGSFFAGWASDRFFFSRRAPVAGVAEVLMFAAILIILWGMDFSPMAVGIGALIIMMAVIGVHSIMSGTATADFGGRKGAATATGIADGFSKLGSSFQEFVLGAIILTKEDWIRWPLFLLPFTLIGFYFAWRLRNALPDATKKYLADVEKMKL